MDDELIVIVEIVRDYGMKVVVYVYGKEGMICVIKVGVVFIEYGIYMDKEVMKLMKKYGIYYVLIILVGNFVVEKVKIDGYFFDIVCLKVVVIGLFIQVMFGKVYKVGVNIVFGIDSGVFVYGDNVQEFVLMVEVGMLFVEVILSVIVNIVKLLDVEEIFGILEVGKLVDIIVVKGNLLIDIFVFEYVQFVMKDGKIYK